MAMTPAHTGTDGLLLPPDVAGAVLVVGLVVLLVVSYDYYRHQLRGRA